MTAPAASVTLSATLSRTVAQWLRLLWDIAPPLRLNSDRPYITAGEIHLPPRNHWRDHTAAAAHATAHLVYSPRSFDGNGLAPIARALMGLLEDARAEALALRDLPGLARLWLPLHTATPDIGRGFEALMQRLARALIDPGYHDPDPWVAKGRALFWRDVRGDQLAVQTPAEVRTVALRLGHDIGQMRLQFNAKTYRPEPAYRDDHRWMWPADVQTEVPPPAAVNSTGSNEAPAPEFVGTSTWYPEWDRLIARLRPDWCQVIEQAPPTAPLPSVVVDRAETEVIHQTAWQLRRALRALSRHSGAPQRDDEGERFDPGALVDRHVARRLRRVTDPRVYRGRGARVARAAVYLLIDQSESTAAIQLPHGLSILQLATASALATAEALHAVGIDSAIAGFSSHGRHAVRLQAVKLFGAPADACTMARAQALRPGGSTRLGAALRHVTRELAQHTQHAQGAQWVIVLSDGEAYDIDVHDPQYLVDDARHAVRAAARAGVRIVCPVLAHERRTDAQRIFGRQGVQWVQSLDELPRALTRLIV